MKHIIFIRHAQSEENVKIHNFFTMLDDIKHLHLPKYETTVSALSLLDANLDARLSVMGHRQIKDISKVLYDEDNFLFRKFQPDIIFHSNLQRTKATLQGIMECTTTLHQLKYRDRYQVPSMDSSNPKYDIYNIPRFELEELRELMPHEYIISTTLDTRMRAFMQLLHTCPHNKILVIGHGKYLKRLLKLPESIRNCDVIETKLQFHSVESFDKGYDFLDTRVIYRTALSEHIPSAYEKKPVDSSQQTRTGTSEEGEIDEPCCRICQATKSEDISKQLIRPCHCSGSLSYVHIHCLQRWRETSRNAYYQCTICKYQYQTKRTWIATILLDKKCHIILTIIIIIIAIICVGLGFNWMKPFFESVLPRVEWYPYSWKHQQCLADDLILQVLCQEFIFRLADVIESGLIIVCVIGFLYHFIRELRHHWIHYVSFIGMLLSVGSNNRQQLVRLSLGIGIVAAILQIYAVVLIHTRALAQKIDVILNADMARSRRRAK